MEREIRKKTLLLDRQGRLQTRGYAKHMNFIYNRNAVRGFPLKLKEWDFYQMQKDHYVLQMTIGHVSYMCSVSATLLDLDTGKRWTTGVMRPFYVPKMEQDPERGSILLYHQKEFLMSFEVRPDRRILRLEDTRAGQEIKIRLRLDNDLRNEKMVIATPFARPTQFYLNYKENYYRAAGSVRFGDTAVDFAGATGLLDWGRGVWPYSHEWFWGSVSVRLDTAGRPTDSRDASADVSTPAEFGLNIGWGFGDLRCATENMYFYKKKAYKIRGMKVERPQAGKKEPGRRMRKEELGGPWKLRDARGHFYMEFTPFFDNYTENRYVVIDTCCHQLFGTFRGYVDTVEGRKEIDGVTGFIEHAVNRW